MKCNYCDSRENKIIFDYARFDKRDILECSSCGLVFMKLRETKRGIEKIYRDDYRAKADLPTYTTETLYNDPVVANDTNDRMKWLKNYYGNFDTLKILELGSASGHLLKALKNAGAEVVGIEPAKNYADFSRTLGLTIYEKPIEDLKFANEFDLIITFHALEHFTDPRKSLKAIKRALKIGGHFMGEVPNQDDWRLKIFDDYISKRFSYNPFHYYYFSPQTLKNYLTTHGGFPKVRLSTVERYNSFSQLQRILTIGKKMETEKILKNDIFVKPKNDKRLPPANDSQEAIFNEIFAKGVNAKLMGNCLRWRAY